MTYGELMKDEMVQSSFGGELKEAISVSQSHMAEFGSWYGRLLRPTFVYFFKIRNQVLVFWKAEVFVKLVRVRD